MRPKELIAYLADVLGLPLETVWVLDRSLANDGLRTKGKGRVPPDMTRIDAIRFLIAIMAAPVATRAAETVREISAYKWQREETSHEERIRYEDHLEQGGEVDQFHKEYPSGYEKQIIEKLQKISDESGEVRLSQYLLVFTEWITRIGGLDSGNVVFEIRTSHGFAAVRYSLPGKGEIHTDIFYPDGNSRLSWERVVINKTASVYGDVLAIFSCNTASPTSSEINGA